MSIRDKILNTAYSLQGKVRYKLGAKAVPPTIPKTLDCSGFVRYCYLSAGVNIEDGTYRQYQCSKAISENGLKKGDLGFMHNNWLQVNHVGIYCGDGYWIHCNYGRNGITKEKTKIFKYTRRILKDEDTEDMNTKKENVIIEMNDKRINTEVINDNGHRYIKVQDFWKLGHSVETKDNVIKIL